MWSEAHEADLEVLSAGDKDFIETLYGKRTSYGANITCSIDVYGKDDETGKIYWDKCWKKGTLTLFGKKITTCIPGFVKKGHEYIDESTSISRTVLHHEEKYITDPQPVAVFKWGGEVRVEVYLGSRRVIENGYVEIGAIALLFEGTSENSSDFEDMQIRTVQVPLNGQTKQLVLKVNNGTVRIKSLFIPTADRIDLRTRDTEGLRCRLS